MNTNTEPLLREQFPVSSRLIYFNHAAVSPLAVPTRRAMEALVADACDNGARHYPRWMTALEETRRVLARLIGCHDDEVAFIKNTSEGLALIALGLDWRAGDRMVVPECEFPANLYPWLTMRERGIRVELLPEAALTDLDLLAARCRGARLLAVSFVQYLSGHRLDLDAVGRICRDQGTLLVVDAIQGLGAFPVDVKRAGIDVLVADGHKWMTGPEGAGVLFVDERAVAQIQPRVVGWMSFAEWPNLELAAAAGRTTDGLPAWRGGAGRYECGTYNTVGAIGLGAAVEMLLGAGIEKIAAHVAALSEHLEDGLSARGCRLRSLTRRAEHRSGIVSFQPAAGTAEALVEWLAAAGVVCAARGGWVRLAPHLYNSVEEADRVLDLVGTAGAGD